MRLFKAQSASIGKFRTRGLIYAAGGLIGFSYELFFHGEPELIVLLLYTAIIGIGVIVFFFAKGE